MSPAVASSSSTVFVTCQILKVHTHFYNISPANSSTESWHVGNVSNNNYLIKLQRKEK